MSGPEFLRDRASASELEEHLRRCDADFVPPLGTRVELAAYASKLAGHATCFEAWAGGVLAGLVAVYCNDRARGVAFITSVSVLPQLQRRGLASRLLAQCVAHAREQGFARIDLQVSAANAGAIDLYTRLGFVAGAPVEGGRRMHLAIERTCQ